ncbi:RNA polymerase subunit sigma-70 [Sphaerisporangium corydalis]|uniref:RNA polymerase sigma factor n=1 Tax=Sphaerisporangium corydalis TaxID=1441875 RepID=A0ABV9EIK6_9ACTN
MNPDPTPRREIGEMPGIDHMPNDPDPATPGTDDAVGPTPGGSQVPGGADPGAEGEGDDFEDAGVAVDGFEVPQGGDGGAGVEVDPVVVAARGGDEGAFGVLVQRHRRELHVHCYRMLGNFEEAEDLVQETFLRAWRARESFHGGPLFRAWLYRIATNACLDHLRRVARRVPSAHSYADIPWLQPYPDRLLDQVAPADAEPDAVIVAKETIELAFLATIQLLPPRQRVVLILRDVLDWPADQTAALLDATVPATNSALQRARATLRKNLPPRRAEWSTAEPSEEERALLQRFIDAHERCDVAAAIAMLRDDIRITMPPLPMCYEGLDAIAPLLQEGLTGPGEWRLVPTYANRQPAAATYLRPWGEKEFRAFKIDVLRVVEGRVAEITTFNSTLFPFFDLPPTI